jgi:hypothetical protein
VREKLACMVDQNLEASLAQVVQEPTAPVKSQL